MPKPSHNEQSNTAWEVASEWLGRTLAIIVVMVVPGLAGGFLDSYLGTKFLQPVGFGVGLAVSTSLLVILAKHLSPPARGKPVAWEDPEETTTTESDEHKVADVTKKPTSRRP